MDSLHSIRVDHDGQSQRKEDSTLKLHENIWFDLVGTYSKLVLTFREDRLPALAGLAEWIQASKNYRYYAGIWEEDLPNALLWQTGWPRPDAKNPRTVDAPSWSWVSMDGPIEYPLTGGTEVATCPRNQCFQLEHRFTRCRKEPLQICGPVVEAKLINEYNEQLGYPSWSRIIRISSGDDSWTLRPGFDYYEEAPKGLPLISDVCLLEILYYQGVGLGCSAGLILKRAGCGIEGEQVYNRIGVFMGADYVIFIDKDKRTLAVV
jgi:hypothetical protein